MKNITFLLLVSFLFTAACSSNKEYPVKITEENGVKTINNPDYPKEGTYDLALEELYTLGKEEDNSKYILNTPVSINIDSRENLYIFDFGGPKFFVFNKKGEYLRSFGKAGSGPGDISLPAYFKISPDDRLIINDGRSTRFSIMDSLGKHINTVLYKSFHTDMELDSKNNFYASYSEDNMKDLSTEWKSFIPRQIIQKYDALSGGWIEIGRYPGHKMRIKRDATGMLFLSSSSLNGFFWKILPSDKLVTAAPQIYEFTFSNLDGKPLYIVKRDYKPFVNKEYKENSGDDRYRPNFTRHTLMDDKENLWVNLDNGINPENYIYDIFTPDGIFLKQVFSKYPLTLFKGDRVYSLIRSLSAPAIVKVFRYSLKKREK